MLDIFDKSTKDVSQQNHKKIFNIFLAITVQSGVSLAFMLIAVLLMLPGIMLAFIGCKGNPKRLHTSGALFISGGKKIVYIL